MIGVSRKAFIRRLSAADSGPELDQASAVMAVLAAERGARLLRVHDVKTTVRMLRLWSASTIDLGHTSSSEAIELR